MNNLSIVLRSCLNLHVAYLYTNNLPCEYIPFFSLTNKTHPIYLTVNVAKLPINKPNNQVDYYIAYYIHMLNFELIDSNVQDIVEHVRGRYE